VKALAATALVTLAFGGGVAHAGNGGVAVGTAPKPRTTRPVLEKFGVTPTLLTPGVTPTVKFLVKGAASSVHLRLIVGWADTTIPQRILDLGKVPVGKQQTLPVAALADPALSEGQVNIRMAGRDSRGRVLRPAARLSRVAQIQVRSHVFPLVGEFSYGGPDLRFGAPRNGHTHQGQDLLAAEGTPVVAVRAGTISYVGSQPSGAGNYVVLDAEGEDYDYAYMHLQDASITVVKGQHVEAGQRIGSVGHTGDATVDHLHFEVWQGTWYAGGTAIDPLPFLQQWQTWSPVTAT
jgi:murein DD-endopeptidase MepM/ murein hydrolase activator NlpD